MQNFIIFLTDLLLYFARVFVRLDYWVFSFPFYLTLASLPVYVLTALLFHKGKVVA